MSTLSNRVILLGNSIFMSGIAASLAAIPDMKVTQVEPCDAGSEALLSSPPAPVIFYDMSMEYPACISCILHHNPAVILIGLDPNSEFAWGPSGCMAKVLSMQDLVAMIRPNHFPAAHL